MEAKTNCSHSSRSYRDSIHPLVGEFKLSSAESKEPAGFKIQPNLLLFFAGFLKRKKKDEPVRPAVKYVWSMLDSTMSACRFTYICAWKACSSRSSVSAVLTIKALEAEVQLTLTLLVSIPKSASMIHFCMQRGEIKSPLTGPPSTVESSPLSP